MYTDALEGSLMFIGMATLFVLPLCPIRWGIYPPEPGVNTSHVPPKLAAAGHLDWIEMPAFSSRLWWILVRIIIMGVGMSVLAQLQLAVRFMTVKNSKELNRAVRVGGVFILCMSGVAFIVGALSNVYFLNNPQFGKISLAVVGGNIDKIIPTCINSAMPVWFVYLFMITLLAAGMSTTSSQFHAMGTSIGYSWEFNNQKCPRSTSGSVQVYQQ